MVKCPIKKKKNKKKTKYSSFTFILDKSKTSEDKFKALEILKTFVLP